MPPRVCVLRAPGTNCDEETAFAFETCGAKAERVHVFALLENPAALAEFQILCIPGGFSYGDDVGAGVVYGGHLAGRLRDAIGEFLQRDTLALGICNGFQVLLKAHLLPDGRDGWAATPDEATRKPAATLTWNDNGRYTARWVTLKNRSPQNVFLRGIDTIELPIAHAEGKLTVADPSAIGTWQESGQLALSYEQPDSNGANADVSDVLPVPWNPNGSDGNIAGLSDSSGRILGLMPHPERFIHKTQHPNWTRRPNLPEHGAGLQLFRNAVDYFA